MTTYTRTVNVHGFQTVGKKVKSQNNYTNKRYALKSLSTNCKKICCNCI